MKIDSAQMVNFEFRPTVFACPVCPLHDLSVCASLYWRLAHAAAVSRVTQRRIQLAVQTALACRLNFIAHTGLA